MMTLRFFARCTFVSGSSGAFGRQLTDGAELDVHSGARVQLLVNASS